MYTRNVRTVSRLKYLPHLFNISNLFAVLTLLLLHEQLNRSYISLTTLQNVFVWILFHMKCQCTCLGEDLYMLHWLDALHHETLLGRINIRRFIKQEILLSDFSVFYQFSCHAFNWWMFGLYKINWITKWNTFFERNHVRTFLHKSFNP